MKNIKVNVSLNNKDDFKKELENLGKSIHLDFGEANKSLKTLVDSMANLNSKFNDLIDGLKGIKGYAGQATKELKGTKSELDALDGKAVKVTISTNAKGDKKVITDYKNSLSETARQIEKNGKVINQSFTTEIEKAEKKIAWLGKSLDDLEKAGVKVGDLKRSFNVISREGIDVSIERVEKLEAKILDLQKSLTKSDSFKIQGLEKLDKLGIEGKLDTSQIEKLKNTLDKVNVRNLQEGISKFNHELNLALKHTSDIKKQTNDLEKEIDKIQKAINSAKNLSSKTGNDSFINSDSFKLAINQLNDMEDKLEEIKKTGNTIDVNELEASIKEAKNATTSLNAELREGNVEYKKVENALSSMSLKLEVMSRTKIFDDSVISGWKTRFEELSAEVSKSSDAFAQAEADFKELGASSNQVKQLEGALEKVNAQLRRAKEYDISDGLEFNSAIASAQRLENALEEVRRTGKTMDIAEIMAEAKVNADALRNSVNGVSRNADRLDGSFRSMLQSLGLYNGLRDVVQFVARAIEEAVRTVTELDTAMRDLRKVSNATQEELDDFAVAAGEIAKNVGASTKEIIEATEYYSKLGYAIDEASERAKNATIFKNIGDFSSIEEASKALITMEKGFNLSSLEDMVRIMDVANEVGNNFSSSTEDIALGMKRMGNVMHEAGNTYEQTVGLFVSANASIQDAESVGNAIKTITMRLRGMETELDETSMPVSKLRDEIMETTATAGKMVDIMSDENTFKSTYDIMTELSEVYPLLEDGQKAYLQYLIAGQRQGNVLSGMLSNMTEGVNAYNTALNATGSAYREQQIYMDSIEGKANQLSQSMNQMWSALIDSSLVKGTLGFFTGIADAMTSVLKIFKPTTVAIYALGTAFFALRDKIQLTTIATKAFNAVMAMSMTGKILLAIGLVAGAIGLIHSQTKTATERMEDMTSAMAQFNAEARDLERIEFNLEAYDELEKKINDANTTTGERTLLLKEQQEVLEELSQTDSEVGAVLANNNIPYEERIRLVQSLIEEQRKASEIDFLKGMGDTTQGDRLLYDLQKYMTRIEILKGDMDELMENKSSYSNSYYQEELSKISEELQTCKKGFIEAKDGVNLWNSGIEMCSETAEELGYTLIELDEEWLADTEKALGDVEHATASASDKFDKSKGSITDIAKAFKEATTDAEGLYSSLNDWNLDGTIDDVDRQLAEITKEAKNAEDAINSLGDAFDGTEDKIELSAQVFEELTRDGYLSGETWDKVIKSNDIDLLTGLGLEGVNQQLEYFKSLNEEATKAREDYANTMIQIAMLETGKLEEGTEAYKVATEAKENYLNQQKETAIQKVKEETEQRIEEVKRAIDLEYEEKIGTAEGKEEELKELKTQKARETQIAIDEILDEANQALAEINGESIENNDAKLEDEVVSAQNAVEEKKKCYEEDETNFDNVIKNKKEAEQNFAFDTSSRLQPYVRNAKTSYEADANNYETEANAKIRKTNEFIGVLNEAKRLIDLTSGYTPPKYGNQGGSANTFLPSYTYYPQNDSEFAPISSGSDVATMSLDGGGEGGEGDGGIAPLAIPGGVQHSSSKYSGSTVGSSPSGSLASLSSSVDTLANASENLASANDKLSDSTSKVNDELKIEYDRYYRLNDVIEDYANLLDEVQDNQESASGKDAIEYRRQENEIIARQIQALRQLLAEQEREQSELRSKLQSQGFLFDSYGNLINSQEKLQDLADWANEGDDERKDHVKDVEDMVDAYTDLANNAIPDTKDSIRDFNNEIKDNAIDDLTSLRDKLVDALRDQREQERDAELDALDERKRKLQEELRALEEDGESATDRKAKLEAELAKWKKDDSAMSLKKQQEILAELDRVNKEIEKDKIQEEIDALDVEQQSIQDRYDKMLDDKKLYEDANNLITEGKTDEMLALLQQYGQDYTDIGVLWGKNLSDAFIEEIKLAMDALELLQGKSEDYTGGVDPSTPPPTTTPPSTTTPPKTTTSPKTVSKGSKVKVTDPNASIYVDSYTSSSSGTWKGAGVSASDTMYVYNMNNGKVALSRTKGGVPIGWIDKKKVLAFDTGGYTGNFEGGQLALLHSKERVLSAQQTQSFEKLVGMLDELVKVPILQLGEMSKAFKNPMETNVSTVTINNDFSITNNTPFDLERQDDNLTSLMTKELRRFGKIIK